MTTSELVFTISSVVNILLLVFVIIMYMTIFEMRLYIRQLHTGVSNLLSRVLTIETVMNKIGMGLTELTNFSGNIIEMITAGKTGKIFKTTDGKYVASSLEELLNKVQQDNAESDYFSEDDLEKLRSMFEQDDSDEEDEDESTPF